MAITLTEKTKSYKKTTACSECFLIGQILLVDHSINNLSVDNYRLTPPSWHDRD